MMRTETGYGSQLQQALLTPSRRMTHAMVEPVPLVPKAQGMVNAIAEQAKQKRQARRQTEDWTTALGRT
jgi:hypothetical protein